MTEPQDIHISQLHKVVW